MIQGASRASGLVLPVIVVLVLGAIAIPWIGEWFADQRTFLGCRSDVYGGLSSQVAQYRRLRGGSPRTWSDLQALPDAGALPSEPRCREAGKPLVWRPEGFLLGSDAVLMMCPLGSHGFRRRYALGITESGVLVRIDSKASIQPWGLIQRPLPRR